jgi:hypothetical protein
MAAGIQLAAHNGLLADKVKPCGESGASHIVGSDHLAPIPALR